MQTDDFIPLTPDDLAPAADAETDWLWHGYLARGYITLLTSLWKAGKTTLLSGLLGRLATDGPFLDRPCRAAKAAVVSEESRQMWATRLKALPIGPHARVSPRPFLGRPTPDAWDQLVARGERLRAAGDLDLFVVDTLMSFLPGRSDSDPGALLDLLLPLRRLADTGVAVLVLHHPRRASSEEGSAARGSGALLGYVDVILELHRGGRLRSDANRRRLVGLSRHPETPRSLVYEWTPGTPDFHSLGDPFAKQFLDNWAQVLAILTGRRRAATHRELLDDWPAEQPTPQRTQLYDWLNRAFAEKLVERTGSGTSTDPYRFSLPRESDSFSLPPLPDLPPLDVRWR